MADNFVNGLTSLNDKLNRLSDQTWGLIPGRLRWVVAPSLRKVILFCGVLSVLLNMFDFLFSSETVHGGDILIQPIDSFTDLIFVDNQALIRRERNHTVDFFHVEYPEAGPLTPDEITKIFQTNRSPHVWKDLISPHYPHTAPPLHPRASASKLLLESCSHVEANHKFSSTTTTIAPSITDEELDELLYNRRRSTFSEIYEIEEENDLLSIYVDIFQYGVLITALLVIILGTRLMSSPISSSSSSSAHSRPI